MREHVYFAGRIPPRTLERSRNPRLRAA